MEMLAAHKALLAADKLSAMAHKALAEAASKPFDSESSARGTAKGEGGAKNAPARRKLAKSKAAGLTPAKSENTNVNIY